MDATPPPTEEDIAGYSREAASPYSRHEVLHTASVVMEMFETHLLNHVVVVYGDDQELRDAAQKTFSALFDFYQLCGRKFLDDE